MRLFITFSFLSPLMLAFVIFNGQGPVQQGEFPSAAIVHAFALAYFFIMSHHHYYSLYLSLCLAGRLAW